MRKLLPIFLVFAMLVTACGGDDDTGADGDTATTESAGVETTAAPSETTAATTGTTATPETTSAPETTEAPTTETTTGSSSTLTQALGLNPTITSARMEGTMTMTGVEGTEPGSEVAMSFRGEFDYTSGNSSFIMDLSDIAGAAPDGEDMPPEMLDLFGEMEMRTIGDTTYMKFGLFSMLGVATEWVSMPAEDAGETASGFGAASVDPFGIIDASIAGEVDVEELGAETVRGVNTTHYRLTVDVAAMMEAADDTTVEDIESLGAVFPDGTTQIEFWVGDDGYVYRMVMELGESADTSTGFESMTMVYEMYDYGANITIEAPPADQVTDGSSLAGMLSG